MSAILARYHMKKRQCLKKCAIPPLRYYLENVLRDTGVLSHTGPLCLWIEWLKRFHDLFSLLFQQKKQEEMPLSSESLKFKGNQGKRSKEKGVLCKGRKQGIQNMVRKRRSVFRFRDTLLPRRVRDTLASGGRRGSSRSDG